MAITTQDGLVAGLGGQQRLIVNKANVAAVAGRTISLWSGAGQPGVGSTTLGQAATGVVPVDSDTGALLFTNGGASNNYLGGVRGISAATGLILIHDVLWCWGSGGAGWSVTSTAAQNTAAPAALTRPDSLGTNTELWMQTLAVGGAASGTSTITYTDSGGTAGNSATLRDAKITTPPVGTIERYALDAGDNGVRSVQTMQNSATWTSGTFRLMIVREIAAIPCTANVGFLYDAYDLGMPRVYDDACMMVSFSANSTATGPTALTLSLIQG